MIILKLSFFRSGTGMARKTGDEKTTNTECGSHEAVRLIVWLIGDAGGSLIFGTSTILLCIQQIQQYDTEANNRDETKGSASAWLKRKQGCSPDGRVLSAWSTIPLFRALYETKYCCIRCITYFNIEQASCPRAITTRNAAV